MLVTRPPRSFADLMRMPVELLSACSVQVKVPVLLTASIARSCGACKAVAGRDIAVPERIADSRAGVTAEWTGHDRQRSDCW
jgi:hypothetical protein